MNDLERWQKLQADYEAMVADRDAWKRRCMTARRRKDEWEQKARRYADALLKAAGVPTEERLGRDWLADLGISGGDG